VSKAAEILKRDEVSVSWENDIDEYGFESMEVNQFCAELNADFAIDTRPTIFLEVTSLERLSDYLKSRYSNAVEARLL
jgi:hypothetical protein